MPNPLVPADFFKPMLDTNAAQSIFSMASYYRVYLEGCHRTDLVINAMLRARDRGDLGEIAGLEGRGFPEAEAWNRIAAGGDPSPADQFLAAALLIGPIDNRVGDIITKKNDLEPKAMVRALNRILPRIEEFLQEPKTHLKESQFPRSTGFMERGETRLGICYLVQLDGWKNPRLFERDLTGEWRGVLAENRNDGPEP